MANVSITKQREAYARTNGKCIICGKTISKNEADWSVEHFVPRAIYKWVHDKNAEKIIESGDNIFIVHPRCNFKKDSSIPTNQLIKSMHADKKTKDEMRDLYKNLEDSVGSYRAIKQSTLSGQDNKCALCGKKLTFNDSTLRRINNRKGRNKSNAMCLCERCNKKASSTETKNNMVNKSAKKIKNKVEP